MTKSAPQIHKLDSALGAQVAGIDLREPLDPQTRDALRNALFEHQVLFFRNQSLSDDAHLAFSENFGSCNLYPVNEMLGGKTPLEFVEDGPDHKPTAGAWHTDVTWLQDPPKIGVLSAQIIPPAGGDTLWCSLFSVYESLSAETRERIDDLDVAHRAGPGFEHLVLKRFGDDFIKKFNERYGTGSTHALVRDHYVTGRRLVYLSGGFMDHVIGWEPEAGRKLIQELMDVANDPRHHVQWKWQVDDLAIWDERSTMHRVDASHWPEPRRMRRCTIS